MFHRRVLELWDYEYNPVVQAYERVAFRALHVTEPAENQPDVFHGMRNFYGAMPVLVQRRIDFSSPPPPSPVPPPGVLPSGPPPTRVPPPRPPPPNFTSPVSPAREESPESPTPSGPYSSTDTPTRRIQPASPPWSPDSEHCDQSLYVARQDHTFSLPRGCPNKTPPPYSASNPPLQPPPEARRRRAPPPPPPGPSRGRGILRRRSAAEGASPYLRPGTQPAPISFQRVRNLFSDFVPDLLAPGSPPMVRTFPGPSTSPEPLPPSRTPSPDIMQEVYSHTRHPVDERSHLTILPSWALKAEKEVHGECVICYGEESHLQMRFRNCSAQKVCCLRGRGVSEH